MSTRHGGRMRCRNGALIAAFAVALTLGTAAGASAQAPGLVTEFSSGITSNSQPFGITAGPDGNLWFAEQAEGGKIARITPTGAVTEFSAGITPNSEPTGITAGPDGNLWFTEQGGDRIGRITPTGTVTQFPVPAAINGGPNMIVSGPDGNLWFTDGNNLIGRITPTGTVTQFEVTSNSFPADITAGPDGNLWFSEPGGSRIGRITPTGTVTEFSSGITPNSFPVGITAGPDGNLWFTEAKGRVGKITPTGTVTEFSSGITSGPQGITAGPDGNLWFTEFQPQHVGRITPTGTVTEFTAGITPSSGPQEITAGPDGNLWFTERAGARIGRVTSGVGVVATCSANSGTVKLSPGLTAASSVQTIKFAGKLTGCSGEAFTAVSYKATLKTPGPVSCSVLQGAGETALGAAKYKWTPSAKASAGSLSTLLTETPGSAFSGEVASGSFSPLTFSGTVSETFAGAATCGQTGAKAVKKGAFSGSSVIFK